MHARKHAWAWGNPRKRVSGGLKATSVATADKSQNKERGQEDDVKKERKRKETEGEREREEKWGRKREK